MAENLIARRSREKHQHKKTRKEEKRGKIMLLLYVSVYIKSNIKERVSSVLDFSIIVMLCIATTRNSPIGRRHCQKCTVYVQYNTADALCYYLLATTLQEIQRRIGTDHVL